MRSFEWVNQPTCPKLSRAQRMQRSGNLQVRQCERTCNCATRAHQPPPASAAPFEPSKGPTHLYCSVALTKTACSASQRLPKSDGCFMLCLTSSFNMKNTITGVHYTCSPLNIGVVTLGMIVTLDHVSSMQSTGANSKSNKHIVHASYFLLILLLHCKLIKKCYLLDSKVVAIACV